AGIKLNRKYNLHAPKGVNGRNSDNTLIRKYLNWEPDTPLRHGLEKTYRWIYDQYLARERGDAGRVREQRASRPTGRFLFKLGIRCDLPASPDDSYGVSRRTRRRSAPAVLPKSQSRRLEISPRAGAQGIDATRRVRRILPQ